jgi:inhibitor of KinA sporulation pathway (predicted exonuclease)
MNGGDLASPDRFAILDLEYTSWPGARERQWSGPGEHREIVEIGLVVVHRESLEEIAGLSLLVRPRHNPVLSDYFRELTGIAQAAVDHAVDFPAAERTLRAVLGDTLCGTAAGIWSFGEDGDIVAENYRLNDLPPRLSPACFRDIRPALTSSLGLPARGVDSGMLPEALGLTGYPPAHRALDDCRAIQAALRVARERGMPW